jgi:hypothetical protein
MRHIKNYKTFEGLIPKYHKQKWDDFLDILRAEDVLTDFDISESELELHDHGLSIHITDKEEGKRLSQAIEATWERTKEYTGHYPHTSIVVVSPDMSKAAVLVTLENMPTITAIYGELGLKTTTYKENGYTKDVTCGVLKSIDHALEAFKYLNGKRRFAYNSDIEPLRTLYDGLAKNHIINRVLLNIQRFDDENYKQYVAFIIELDGVIDNPIYVINSNRTDSPFVFIRYGNASWNHLNIDKAIIYDYK